MFGLFLRYRLAAAQRYFKTNRAAKLVTAFLFTAVILFIAFAMFFFFRSGFRFVSSHQFFRTVFPLYLYELFLMVIFVLVLASALITGLFAMFRAEGDELIMSSPRFGMTTSLVFTRVFVSSLWPLVVVALPALLAIRSVFGLSGLGLGISLASVFILTAFAVLLALALILLSAGILRALQNFFDEPTLTLGSLGLAVSLIFATFLGMTWARLGSLHLSEFFQARALDISSPDISRIVAEFYIFPSHYSAMTIYSSQVGNVIDAFIQTVLFAALFLLGWALFSLLSSYHLVLWQVLREGGVRASAGAEVSRSPAPVLKRVARPLGAVFAKELITFTRNARGMMWLGFLLLMWLIQTGSNFILSRQVRAEALSGETLPSVVQIFQFATMVYFVSMFVLRFAFPSFSSERKSAWIIASAPLDLANAFIAKFFFYSAVFVFLSLIFSFINASVLGISFGGTVVFSGTVIVAALFITAFGLGLGAVFPNFETDDPEVLSTSLAGLGFIFGSLIYGAWGAAALQRLLAHNVFLPFGLFLAVSAALTILFIFLPRRRLRNLEFI